MKAIKSFQPIAHNMSKKRAFKLIADAEGLFKDVEDPLDKWPIHKTDTKAQIQNKRSRYLACFLIRMEEDLRQMEVMQPRENQVKQDTWYREFCEIFPGAVIAKVGFSTSHLKDNSTPLSSPSIPVVRAPILGPYAQENRLEPINRCWNILKYFRYCCQSKDDVWQSRFSAEGITQSILINEKHVPSWMRKPEEPTWVSISKTSAVDAADNLQIRQYPIVWQKGVDFDGKDELDEALAKAKAKNIRIPSDHQTLAVDPRLLLSAAAFKDSIRRQFNCENLVIDIRSLEMVYTNKNLSKTGRLTKDILQDPWEQSKSTFIDATNEDIILNILFEALDDPDQNIYESFEPPPGVSAFFDTSSGDVATRTDELIATAVAAFELQQRDASALPTSDIASSTPAEGRENLPAFLDLAFSCGTTGADIGSIPDPRKKFPRAQDHKSLVAYYDGFDVTTEEGKRNWQRRILEKLSMNSTAANVKLEKLPKSFSKDQTDAIEEARFIGERMAVAREGDETADVSILSSSPRIPYYLSQVVKYFLTSNQGQPIGRVYRGE
jgi:hypothetical protein